MSQSILVIDDEPTVRSLFIEFLAGAGFEVHAVSTLGTGRDALSSRSFDAVIIDQTLPDGRGTDLIRELRAGSPEMAIVVMSGAGDIPLAVEAMRRGADTFLTKPVDLDELIVFLQKSLELRSLRKLSRAHQRLEQKSKPDFGTSGAMRRVMEFAGLASGNGAPVLITGETGSGKGVLARWIHENSARNAGSFVEVNCSSLRGELLASELFGHSRGAFTSAVQDRQGLLDVADGGTLFLDEIGDMDLAVQAQFLKVIEEKSYHRLGEVKTRNSDFRLICATNKDLAEEAAHGRFRKDLMFRVQVLLVHVPALRERREDIPGLARHVLAGLNYRYRDLSPDVFSILQSYSWPGNVRELRNILERAVLLATGDMLSPAHFSCLQRTDAVTAHEPSGELDRLEMDSIRAALKRLDGDVNRAAEELGISRATIYRKLKKAKSQQD